MLKDVAINHAIHSRASFSRKRQKDIRMFSGCLLTNSSRSYALTDVIDLFIDSALHSSKLIYTVEERSYLSAVKTRGLVTIFHGGG